MNRDIEFRGKHIHLLDKNKKLDGTWVYGYLCNENYIYSEKLDGDMLVDKNTIGQYTGLKDKNGKKIFEGDIYHHGDPSITYTVVWHDTGLIGKQNNSSSYAGLEAWKDRIEVIGNIYENNLESKGE